MTSDVTTFFCLPDTDQTNGSMLGPPIFMIIVDIVIGCWLAIVFDGAGDAFISDLMRACVSLLC